MHPSWLAALEDELETPHMQSLRAFLAAERAAGRTFFPPADRVFNALWLTPFEDVRVIVLGQDPYHGPGQAMGLSFSVPPGVPPPPSLVNIFKELGTDLGLPTPASGDLTPWAERGVLLLNAVLTVAPRAAGSHAGRAGSSSPIGSCASSPTAGKGWSSSSGAGTHSRRARSSTARAITCSRPPTPPRSRPAASSAAVTSPGRTYCSRPEGRAPVDWRLP